MSNVGDQAKNTGPVVAFFAAMALFKLGLAIGYGAFAVDSDYIDFADLILNGPYHWLHDAELNVERWWNPHNFRIIGYPLLIALFKTVFGGVWVKALVTAQSLYGLLVAVVFYRFLRGFTGSRLWALFGVLCYESGEILLFDSFINPDTFYARTMTLIAMVLFGGVWMRRHVRFEIFLWLGLAFAFTFLLREFTATILFLYLPFAVYWVWQDRGSVRAVVLACLLMAVPTWTLMGGYMAWNHHRTGHAFVTLAARYVFLMPLANLAQQGVPVFDKGGPLDETINDVRKNFPIPYEPMKDRRIAEWQIADRTSNELWKRHRIDSYTVYKDVSARYVETAVSHPWALLKYAATLDPRTFFLFWNPIKPSLPWEHHDISNHSAGLGLLFTQVQSWGWLGEALVLIPQFVPKPFTILMAAAFFFVFPVRYGVKMLRTRGTLDGRWHALAFSWLLFMGTVAFYALIVVTTRYFTFVLPLAIVVAIAMLQDGQHRIAARWRGSHQGRL